MQVRRLDGAPRQVALLARAAVPRRRPHALPQVEVVRAGVPVDVAALGAYQRALGFTQRDAVPASYVHVLAFPLQLALMGGPDFPVPLIGLVHVANALRLHRRITAGDRLDLAVHAERLRPHRRGALVDLVGRASADGEPVWSGRSTYLAMGAEAPGEPDPADAARDEPLPGPAQARWRLGADTGRRYAAVSGDHNPIHLHPLAARAFGFPRAIAHGMDVAARVLAWLEPRVPPTSELTVRFAAPVLLPATVDVRTAPATGAGAADDGGWRWSVSSRSGRLHAAGRVGPPP